MIANPNPARPLAGHREYRILVIDDEPDSLRILLEMMRAFGLELASAPNAAIGLRNARAVNPDLIPCWM